MRHKAFVIFLVISFITMGACSSKPGASLSELVAANESVAKKSSDQIGRVLEAAYRLLPVQEFADGAVKEKLGFQPFLPKEPGAVEAVIDPAFNAIVLEEQDLPSWAPKTSLATSVDLGPISGLFPTDVAYSIELALVGTYNGKAPLIDNPIFVSGVKNTFAALPQIRYVLVLHPIRAVLPQRTSTDEFSPGVFEGEARLFSLQDASYLGGFAFTAKNDETVLVKASHYDSVEVKYNLMTNASNVLLQELSRRGLTNKK